MSTPPILLILDVSTLTKTDIRDWIGFSRAGTCFVPQMVFEEMRFLYDRSPDSDLERVSREFNRFYSNSDWQITEVTGHHPLLKSSSGRALTRRVRVALAVARCAYGMAQNYSQSLVVLVASDQTILQRIEDVRTANLIAISSADLLQWSRSGQRPTVVHKTLQALRNVNLTQSNVAIGATDRARNATAKSQTVLIPRRTSIAPSSSRHRNVERSRGGGVPHDRIVQTRLQRARIKSQGDQIIAILTALVSLAFAGAIVWALFSTTYFDQFLPSKPPGAESNR
ncbi:MAG: PIN domain-containing protein [Elainellaceae cyanobacterium]